MEIHTFTVNFWASPSKARKTGLMPIYVTIRMNGERATFTTGKYKKGKRTLTGKATIID